MIYIATYIDFTQSWLYYMHLLIDWIVWNAHIITESEKYAC